MWLLVFQRLALDAVLDLLYFPFWWYTGGVVHSVKWCCKLFLRGNENLAPLLWLKNLFVPMFGQYDWQGRIISFFMRFFQFCFRTLALIFWSIFCFILFLIWLALPAVIVMSLVFSFTK